jgi:hypothetical protein
MENPKTLTHEGLLAYFDQMADEKGRVDTTADWLADVGMLIVHEVAPDLDRLTAENAALLERVERLGDALRHLGQIEQWAHLSNINVVIEEVSDIVTKALALGAGKEKRDDR